MGDEILVENRERLTEIGSEAGSGSKPVTKLTLDFWVRVPYMSEFGEGGLVL